MFFEIQSKRQNVDSEVMRLNLLKYPLVLKKNESIRGQEKGQYNGLLFLPQDMAPSGPTNLSPNRPSIYLQSIYHLFNQLLPPAPNYELSPVSVLGLLFF